MCYPITAESEDEGIFENLSTFAEVIGKNQSRCFFSEHSVEISTNNIDSQH